MQDNSILADLAVAADWTKAKSPELGRLLVRIKMALRTKPDNIQWFRIIVMVSVNFSRLICFATPRTALRFVDPTTLNGVMNSVVCSKFFWRDRIPIPVAFGFDPAIKFLFLIGLETCWVSKPFVGEHGFKCILEHKNAPVLDGCNGESSGSSPRPTRAHLSDSMVTVILAFVSEGQESVNIFVRKLFTELFTIRLR
jgi:hypothetical protein